jgi:hypothetical protein
VKDKEKIDLMKECIKHMRPYLEPEGNSTEAIRLCLKLFVDYIDFMLTPCEDDEE